MNSMVVAIPPKVRTIIYLIYAIVGIGAGATQVGYATAEVGFPPWLKIFMAVYTFLGGAIGYTAATHTPATNNEVQEPSPDYEGGYASTGLLLTVVGVVLIIIGILALLKVLAISLAVSIILVVIGLLLVVFGRAGTP